MIYDKRTEETEDYIDELLLELNYLYNYNELLDIELDEIDGKVDISHLRCLTHSLKKEIIQAGENAEKIFKNYHKKDYE